ncbi:MAG: hypothetical protein WEA04_03225 [Candidatus Andersenbacteria bacterium]
MSYRSLAVALLLLALTLGLGGLSTPATHAATAPSPTGREPRIMWSPEWQASWERARAEQHPWYLWLETATDDPENPNDAPDNYFDKNFYPTLLYQMTGEVKWARKAWDNSLAAATDPAKTITGNGLRSLFLRLIICYEWLYPALSDAERTQIAAKLDAFARKAAEVRISDSDESTSYYFGVAAWAHVSQNPEMFALLEQMGGLKATALDRTTVRNGLASFAPLAQGGEWLESTTYNRGTTGKLWQALQAMEDITGREHFPEYRALVPDYGRAMVHRLTPDLNQQWSWGAMDELWMHSLGRGDFLLPQFSSLAQLNKNNELGPILYGFIHEFMGKQDKTYNQKPRADFYLFADPYAPADSNWRSKLPLNHFASGQGLLYARDGWQLLSSLFGAHTPPYNNVDHPVHYMGDWQLYRKGEWVVTHPWSYDDLGSADGLGRTNTMLIGNLPGSFMLRQATGQESGEGYHWLAGETGGPFKYGRKDGNDVPIAKEYLHSWQRALVYLPTQDATADTVVIYDRVDADQPVNQLADRSPYHWNFMKRHEEYVAGGIPLKQWIIHASVKPDLTPTGFAWQTPGQQTVQVTPLLPTERRFEFLDEKVLFSGRVATWQVSEKERKWQARVIPARDQQWDTFLNVVNVTDTAGGVTSKVIKSTNNAAEGALIERPNQPSVATLFNAEHKREALHTSGFTAAVTSTAPTTNVLLFDLDPQKSWQVAIDTQAATPLAVSNEGVARFSLSGAGEHSFTLQADDEEPAANAAPAITSDENTYTVEVGKLLEFDIVVTDEDGDDVTVSVRDLETLFPGATLTSLGE